MKLGKADFPDWLAPMLVKELRQGLKTRGFGITFVLLQVIFIVLLICNVLSFWRSPRDFDPSTLNKFFWFLVGAQLLGVTPLRALNELAAERKAQTIELIFLSGLTAWRITWGKWVSLLFQAVLVILAILPYGILRYYFGAVDISEDLEVIGVLLVLCGLLTAVLLAVSGLGVAVRGAALLLGFFGLMTFSQYAFYAFFFMGRGSLDFGEDWWLLLYDAVILSLLALEYAAASIAPVAENHAGRQRALVLLLWLPMVGLAWSMRFASMAVGQLMLYLIVGAIVCWQHFGVAPLPLQSYCRPFAGKRTIMGIPFQPGWPGAFAFLLLGILLCVALPSAFVHSVGTLRSISAIILLGGALMSGIVVWVLLRRRSRRPLLEQSIFHLLCATGALMLSAGEPRGVEFGSMYGLAFLPGMGIFAFANNQGKWEGEWLAAALASSALYTVVLLFLSRRYWAHYFRTCRSLSARREPAALSIT